MTLKQILDNKSINYWDFKNSKLEGIHKISPYPATMVPDMQAELIKSVIENDKYVKNILDPFHGSGVTLVEGMRQGLFPIGFDINPLANLITKVKLQGVDKYKIKNSIFTISKLLSDDEFKFELHSFNNIDKWFRNDVILSLSKIREAIKLEKSSNIRQYFWVCLISSVKKYSNTRTSTFKLHIKKEIDIKLMENNVIEDFLKNIKNYYQFLPDFSNNKKINLFIGDSINLTREIENESIDLICTSPPYGDNGTTVTYGQYSMLPIYWIDRKDLGAFDDKLIKNYSSIDSASLGGKNLNDKFHYESSTVDNYIQSIAERKRKKVIKFIDDYLKVISELKIKLKKNKFIILTLGNRRVDNKIVPLTEITQEFLEENGFIFETKLTRNIPSKRMPRKLSRVRNHSVSSMNTEYVLIMKKGE